jgi:hypothetical protein
MDSSKNHPFPKFFILFLVCITSTTCLAQDAIWATHIRSGSYSYLRSVCTDNNDNIYITGTLYSGASVNGEPVNIQGLRDVFLTKLNSAGEHQWTKLAGNSWWTQDFAEIGFKVSFDAITNGIYVAGRLAGNPIVFPNETSFVTNGAFLARYSTDGDLDWVRWNDHGYMNSIVFDPVGNVIVIGSGELDVQFIATPDSLTFEGDGSYTIPNGFFAAKYSPQGERIWIKNLGSNISASANYDNGRVILYGMTKNSHAALLNIPIPSLRDTTESLIAEVNSEFDSLIWVTQFRSSGISMLSEHLLINEKDHFISGIYIDTLFTSTDTLSGPPGEFRPFFMRLDSAGSLVQHLADLSYTSNFAPQSVKLPSGNILMTLTTTEPLVVNGTPIQVQGPSSVVVAQLDPDGALVGEFSKNSLIVDRPEIVSLSDGSIVLAGEFIGTIDLGNDHVLTGGRDIFVAKFDAITGIPDYLSAGSDELLIYANPNQGTCTIELPDALHGESDLLLRVLDLSGRVVQEAPISMQDGTIRIDIRAQATGTYIAEVGNGRVRYRGRIVFE